MVPLIGAAVAGSRFAAFPVLRAVLAGVTFAVKSDGKDRANGQAG
jgi:hypothetical protein